MQRRDGTTARKGERGAALVNAIALLALLSAAGIVLLRISEKEVRTNVADLGAKQVFYLAEAGIEQAREDLRLYRKSIGDISVVGKLVASRGANGALDAAPDAITVAFDAAGNPTLGGYGDDVPLIPLTAWSGGWYAAFLTNDVAESPGGRTNATTDANKRVMVIGVGVRPDRAFDVSDAVIDTGPDMPVPPATITVLGDAPLFDSGSSGAKSYWGDDCRSLTIPGSWTSQGSFDIVGVTSAGALAIVQNDIGNLSAAKQDEFQTGLDSGSYRTGAATAADVTTNPWYLGYPEFSDCTKMVELGDRIRDLADAIVPAGSDPAQPQIGSPGDPKIVYCEGDCTISGTMVGYGVLWVKGDLTLHGGVAWYGQVYVVGSGQLYRTGAGGGSVYGSMIIANTMNGACNGPSTGGFGVGAQYDMSGGGNSITGYCSYYNKLAWAASPLRLRSFRQQ